MLKKDNWDSGKKSVGEISDQHVWPQDERKTVQKRAFTKWMNVFLQRCDPPLEVHDLFADIRDGRILMALLEELSGCKLLYRFRSPTHRIFRLNNISKALAFLDDRHVKLLSIDASGIADGIPSVVLNLVWNIILYFQVKEVTGGLQRHLSSSLSSLSMSSYPSSSDLSPQPNDIGSYSCYTLPSKGRKAARESKYHGKAIKTLLQWVQRCTSKFGVEVHDFGKSWRSGLAFLAMIKSINPDLVKLRESLSKEPRANIEQAFAIAHQSLDIPPLLEPEDVTCASPDEQSIITYVSMFLGQCPDINQDYTTDIDVCEIPKFGSLDSLTFGETTAYEPQAQAWHKGLETPVWKHWSRASSGSPCAASFPMNGAVRNDVFSGNDDVFSPCHSITEQSPSSPAFSTFNKNKGRNRFGGLQPPSLLGGGVAGQKSYLWMDQGYKRQKVDDLSLSSEEEIYSLSTLDSDEEDAYSYILDLNKEVFLPHNQLKRQVPRVEEETADELNEELNHPESCEMPNGSGCKQQEGSFAQNADIDLNSEAKAHSVVHRKFALDEKHSTSGDMANTGAVFDTEPEDESSRRESPEEEKDFRGQGNGDYSEEEKTEHVRVVTRGYDETAARVDEAEKTMLWEMSRWHKEAEEDSKKGLSLKCLQVNENIDLDTKEEMCFTFDDGKNGKLDQKEENGYDTGKEEDRKDQESVQRESFGLGANVAMDESVHEVGSTRATTVNKRGQGEACRMEDLPKISKNEKKEKHATDLRNPEDLEAAVTAEMKDGGLKTRRRTFTDSTVTTVDHPVEATLKHGAGVNIREDDSGWTPVCKMPHWFSSEGGLLQSAAALCDITPLELETLLVLWILLYCCLILSQMNL